MRNTINFNTIQFNSIDYTSLCGYHYPERAFEVRSKIKLKSLKLN